MRRKVSMIVLAALMMTVLFTACSGGNGSSGAGKPTAQSLMEAANKTASDAKSTELNMDMALSMNYDDGENSQTMDIGMNMDIQSVAADMSSYMKGSVSMNGLSVNMEEYTVTEDDKIVTYIGAMGSWMKQETALTDAQQTDYSAELASIFNSGAEMTLAEETAKADDKEVYVLTGTVEGKEVAGFLGSSENLLSSITGGSVDAESEDTLDYSGLSADIEIGIDSKTKQPAYMNMTVNGMETLFAAAGEDMSGLSIPKCEVKITFTGFDTVDKITVPQDVIDNAQVSVQ